MPSEYRSPASFPNFDVVRKAFRFSVSRKTKCSAPDTLTQPPAKRVQQRALPSPRSGPDGGLATEFIHERIIEKRNQGCAVLLISADLDELFRLSDRLVTLFEGRITGDFASGGITKEEIGYYMTGGKAKEAAK